MNDSDNNHPPMGGSNADRVRDAVTGAASGVDVGVTADTLAEVRSTAQHRRRRRNAFVGVAAAATLTVGGVVVTNIVSNGDEGDEMIVSAPVTEPEVTDGSEPVADDTAPDSDSPASTEPVATPPPASTGGSTVSPATAEVVAPTESFDLGSYQQLFAWQGGFLTIGQSQVDQPLPAEFADEILAAFPEEVTQFFDDAGGLPATINEAIAMLQEAGLYDEVADVVLNNPEVYDAVYSMPVDPPVSFARVSPDGITWSDIDLELPADMYGGADLASDGERFAVASFEYADVDVLDAEPSYQSPPVTALVVRVTTDLENWTSQRIDLAAETFEDPPYIRRDAYLNALAINDTGWVAGIEQYSYVDYNALLPDDFDRSFENSEYGYGLYHDDDGLVLDLYDENGQPEQQHIPWAELGFTETPVGLDEPMFDHGGGGRLIAASWDGEPVVVESSGDYLGQTVGFEGGFIRQANRLLFSVDGVTWVDLDNPEGSDWVTSLLAVPGGVMAFTGGYDTPAQAFRLDVDTLTWEASAEPVLPEGFSPRTVGGFGAMLYAIEDYSDVEYSMEEFEPFVIEVENDLYRFEATIGAEEQTYTLVELSSGDVVLSESATAALNEVAPFDYLVETDTALEFISPDTGEVLTSFTYDELARATEEREVGDAPADTVPATTVVVESGSEYVEPEWVEPQVNVLATNGEVWINQSLDLDADPSDPDFAYANEVALSNGIVLVSMSDGSFIRFTF